MSRADYVRVQVMGEAARQASELRREKDERKAFLEAQRRDLRRRGAALREERFHTEESIADAIEQKREHAQAVGNSLRVNQEMLRFKRVVQDRAYRTAGKKLTEKYSTRDNQDKVRQLKADLCDEKTDAANKMRDFLKRAKKQTDDNIMEVNTDRCRRVYQDTAHNVIRYSKAQTIARRWDRADYVRDEVVKWRAEAKERDDEYVERARAIRDEVTCKDAMTLNAATRREALLAKARERAEHRQALQAERHSVVDTLREQNRDVHDAVGESQLVLEEEVAAVAGGKEPLAKLSRFFDFRRFGLAAGASPRGPTPQATPRVAVRV